MIGLRDVLRYNKVVIRERASINIRFISVFLDWLRLIVRTPPATGTDSQSPVNLETNKNLDT